MATEEQLIEGLRRADAAGNTADAQSFADAIKSMRAQSSPTASPQQQQAAQAPAQHESFGQSVGKYFGGIEQGLYRPVQSIVELGARGLDATGITREAYPTVKKAIDSGNRIGSPDQESKYTKAGDVVGQIGATAPLAALRIPGAGLAAATGSGVAQGVGSAALTSAASDAPLGEQLAGGGIAGGIGGAAMHGVGKLAGMVGRTPPPAAPTGDDLRAGAKAAYGKAESAGIIIKKDSWKNAVADIKRTAIDEGLHPALHPKAVAVLGELENVDQHLTLDGAERLRRIVGGAAKSIEPDERRIAMIAKEKLDDYLTNIGPADVLGGDPKIATDALKEARDQWSRMRNGELMDDLITRAGTRAGQFTGSGFENALRTEFRQLALNAKKMRFFNEDEAAAIKKVAEGGPLGNAMRWVGKFAPRGVVSTAAGQAIGHAVGGPIGGFAAPVLGEVGRMGATAATSRNAQMAAELMRRGSVAPAATPNPRALLIAEALKRLPVASGLGASIPALIAQRQ